MPGHVASHGSGHMTFEFGYLLGTSWSYGLRVLLRARRRTLFLFCRYSSDKEPLDVDNRDALGGQSSSADWHRLVSLQSRM
jgi:hypothetical protein